MKLLSWLQEPNSPSGQEDSSEPPSHEWLLRRLSELNTQPVSKVMVPRALVRALDVDVQLRRVRRLRSSKISYFPVYKGDLDQMLGWISKSKVLELLNSENSDEARLEPHIKPMAEVDEGSSVAALGDAFLKASSPLVVVRNAQGSTVGVISLPDFVELLFGFELMPSVSVPASSDQNLRGYEI